VHLEGFGLEDTHSVANSLRWGPDGWLYGCGGSTTTGNIIRPGLDKTPTRFLGQCIWRYHPETKRFEVFAEGGGNAFGLEIDAKGRASSPATTAATPAASIIPKAPTNKKASRNTARSPILTPSVTSNKWPAPSGTLHAHVPHLRRRRICRRVSRQNFLDANLCRAASSWLKFCPTVQPSRRATPVTP
jgi:hypothetical protein